MTGSSAGGGGSAADSGEFGVADTAARYLADELSAADAAAFEARVAAEPQLYRDIDYSLRLREGLATLRDRGELVPLMRRDRRRAFASAAAIAAAALLIGIVWLSRTAQHSEPVILARAGAQLLDESGKALPIGARVTLLRTRGAARVNEVMLPAARAAIELVLLPPSLVREARYTVFLIRRVGEGSPVRGEIRGVTVDASGYLDLFIDSSTLEPGAYAIELRTGDGETGVPEGEIAFDVIPRR
jgi:hypothetical protein